ncbi:hypothetical protein AGR3A_Cc210011 [Agrobacterium tomkonis CFBP 6623]|uniref:Uncharacterized protein n=1 Tax=Agrobacterium tomkonis CFBP 6623 TaxID=1183432 RepID=A0A1S7P9V6_9HYPH|nr:hypothetical protein AGR3A_Cc210011 [Agrobacterium tomkonis CFBP 6623]
MNFAEDGWSGDNLSVNAAVAHRPGDGMQLPRCGAATGAVLKWHERQTRYPEPSPDCRRAVQSHRWRRGGQSRQGA